MAFQIVFYFNATLEQAILLHLEFDIKKKLHFFINNLVKFSDSGARCTLPKSIKHITCMKSNEAFILFSKLSKINYSITVKLIYLLKFGKIASAFNESPKMMGKQGHSPRCAAADTLRGFVSSLFRG